VFGGGRYFKFVSVICVFYTVLTNIEVIKFRTKKGNCSNGVCFTVLFFNPPDFSSRYFRITFSHFSLIIDNCPVYFKKGKTGMKKKKKVLGKGKVDKKTYWH
jgi:hypothetical protein